MEEESSRFKPRAPRAWSVAALLAVATFGVGAGVAVAGCGGDDNSPDVNQAIDSVQSQASSVQSQISSAATGAQEQAQSVKSQAETQVQSVQSQISTATSNSGGYGY
jgi:predicted PurR-regulated permease PerM